MEGGDDAVRGRSLLGDEAVCEETTHFFVASEVREVVTAWNEVTMIGLHHCHRRHLHPMMMTPLQNLM